MIHKDLALFQELTEQLLKAESEEPVVEPIPADELYERLDLDLPEEPTVDEDFTASLRGLILHTPRTATRRFFNQLFGGRNGKAVLGDLLAVVLNNSMYTYKVAGPMVGVEKNILNQIAHRIGYGDTSDGTLAPGGSMTNFMGMLMARDAYRESIREEGVQGKLTLYTSNESHYSIPKNAMFMGVGRKQVRYVPSDDKGRMAPDALKKMIEDDKAKGLEPFLVIATAGTTVMGAFDPINALADICEANKMWLHVDGAYCGSVLFTDKYRHLIKGVERSHSFSVNAHKMLGTPLSCSIIVVNNKRFLYESFANDASYLYQTHGDDFNLGKTSLQCGRRNDALKFWTLWKAVGRKGLAEMVDRQFDLAQVARDYIRDNADKYTLYSFDDSVNICFNYKDIAPETLCNRLYEEAELVVGYGEFKKQRFIRLVTVNAGNTKEDILEFFEKMEAFAEEMLQEA